MSTPGTLRQSGGSARWLRNGLMSLVVVAAAAWLADKPVASAESVDLELVLAVDVSRSMDYGEQVIQRKGYAEAFRSQEVIDAILGGGLGRIAVTYMEWAGEDLQRVIVPWVVIDSPQASRIFADALERHQPDRLSRTSISGGLLASGALFGTSQWAGVRRVVDVSGDGPNNQGSGVEAARDELVARGIVINGLPLLVRPTTYGFGIDNLDDYYIDCVIGGPGSFSLPVRDWVEFPVAVRRKLVLEIAGNPAAPLLVPVAQMAKPLLAQTRAKTDCFIGERLWEIRMRDMEWR